MFMTATGFKCSTDFLAAIYATAPRASALTLDRRCLSASRRRRFYEALGTRGRFQRRLRRPSTVSAFFEASSARFCARLTEPARPSIFRANRG